MDINKLFENTLFINLEHRTDRLAHVISELNKMNIPGSRFNAIKTTDGAVGCTLSHIKCLEMAIEAKAPYVFICEDDIHFLNPELFKTNLKKFLDDWINWDVIIVSGNACPPYTAIGDYAVKVTNCQTTTGYIVAQSYYEVLLANYKEGVQKLLQEPKNKRQYAIDIWWKRLQAVGNWYMIVPPTVVQMEGFSDVENRFTNYTRIMTDMTKEWLFKPLSIPLPPAGPESVPLQPNLMFNSRPSQIQHNAVEKGFNLGIKFRGNINGNLVIPK